jgi:hypothetical protein
MSHSPQLLGIIEIDADSRQSERTDATLGETLSGLRGEGELRWDTLETAEVEVDRCQVYDAIESIHLLHADLPQLRTDLESELRRLIQRLLAAM